MGCCFSSTFTPNTAASKPDPEKQNYLKRHHSPLKPPILQSHKTPFPQEEEEEEEEEEAVIKEVLVLSETPKLHENQQEKITQTLLPLPPETRTEVSNPIKEHGEEKEEEEQETSHLSQRSEIYCISETISTTTPTTATATSIEDPKEDEATSKENSQVKHKFPAKVIKKRPSNGDPGRVRARRVEPQPEKRARGQGRGLGEVRIVQRNVGSRSRSPGTERAGGVGNGAVGKSPTTVTSKIDNKPIGSASATVEGQSKREEEGNNDDLQQQQRTESLENPLVSLECFIFL